MRATFDAPAANYRINAIQIHLAWDPDLLDLLPVTSVDQAQTVLGDIGTYFLPTDASYAIARATGDLRVSWLGFQFSNPTEPDFLYPGMDLDILRLRFRSKVPGDAPSTFAKVTIVSDPKDDLPTAFFPEVDVPSEPDLEAFIDGGREWVTRVIDAAPEDLGIEVFAEGGAATVASIDAWHMAPVWDD